MNVDHVRVKSSIEFHIHDAVDGEFYRKYHNPNRSAHVDEFLKNCHDHTYGKTYMVQYALNEMAGWIEDDKERDQVDEYIKYTKNPTTDPKKIRYMIKYLQDKLTELESPEDHYYERYLAEEAKHKDLEVAQ